MYQSEGGIESYLGVIRKISEPTEWCAGMVVVPKKLGAIRICVDLKPVMRLVKVGF